MDGIFPFAPSWGLEKIQDDEVEIRGPNVPPHELSRATGMVPEEFFARLSLAIPREILDSSETR